MTLKLLRLVPLMLTLAAPALAGDPPAAGEGHDKDAHAKEHAKKAEPKKDAEKKEADKKAEKKAPSAPEKAK